MKDKTFITRVLSSFIGESMSCRTCPMNNTEYRRKLLDGFSTGSPCYSIKSRRADKTNRTSMSCEELILQLSAEYCLNSKELMGVDKVAKGKSK